MNKNERRHQDMEKLLKTMTAMDEIGSSNDDVSELIQREKFKKGRALSLDDLDMVMAAQSKPDYAKFMEFVLDKKK